MFISGSVHPGSNIYNAIKYDEDVGLKDETIFHFVNSNFLQMEESFNEFKENYSTFQNLAMSKKMFLSENSLTCLFHYLLIQNFNEKDLILFLNYFSILYPGRNLNKS